MKAMVLATVAYFQPVGLRILGAGGGLCSSGMLDPAMMAASRAVPCWIMPHWRVSEQMPADLAAFDLVVVDEASQSNVKSLPAILRGDKLLIVGDAPFSWVRITLLVLVAVAVGVIASGRVNPGRVHPERGDT